MIEPGARVLVICVARIGDTLLSTPVLRSLAAALPRGTLSFSGHPDRIEVMRGLPYLKELRGVTPRAARLRGWFGTWFDYALVYGRDAPLVEFALRRAKKVIAFEQEEAKLNDRLWHCARSGAGALHAVDDRAQLLAPLELGLDSRRLDYRVAPEEADWAEAWITAAGLAGHPLVGLQLASFPTKAYRDWPLENFVALAQRIAEAKPDVRFVVFGDAKGRAAGETLAKALPDRVAIAAGKAKLRQSAALMARLALYVGVDTGPTHIAGALGVPMVAMYHCLHRGRHLAPLEHPAYLAVIEHPAADGACSEANGMDAIGVDTVWARVEEALA